MREHIANKWLETGLTDWQRSGAKVYLLENNDLRIPIIDAPPVNSKQKKIILAGFGLHLEETSGIKFVLDPDNFEAYRKSGFRFIIFPVVNQFGLKHNENSHETMLRYDDFGRNYNDGWGDCEAGYKTNEMYLIEEEIRRLNKIQKIDLCLSYHEDSDIPQKGYIYTLGMDEMERLRVARNIKTKIDNSLLAEFITEYNDMGGFIEHGMIVAEEYDPRALENWVYRDLEIPSVLIEGPFGCDLETRIDFQRKITESILNR